jgi:hypothetical protein
VIYLKTRDDFLVESEFTRLGLSSIPGSGSSVNSLIIATPFLSGRRNQFSVGSVFGLFSSFSFFLLVILVVGVCCFFRS